MGACSTGACDLLTFDDVSEPMLAKLFLFLQEVFFFFVFLCLVIAATSLGSTGPVYSFTLAVESVSNPGIRIGEAIQDCEVWEWDNEEDDDEDKGEDKSFPVGNNQPTAPLINCITFATKEST